MVKQFALFYWTALSIEKVLFKFDFQCYLSGVHIMSELHKVSSRSCSNSSQPRLSGCEQISADQTASNAECLANLSAAADTPQNWEDIFSNLPEGNSNGFSVSGRESNPKGPVPSANDRRKVLTTRRKLLLDLKHLHAGLTECKSLDQFFEHEFPYFETVRESYETFICTLNDLDIKFKRNVRRHRCLF